MRLGSYKELTFPPVNLSSQKSIPVTTTIKERSPSPMDLCTTKKPENPKEKKVALEMQSTVLRSPFDYLPPSKKRKFEDTRILPAHQGKTSSICSLPSTDRPMALMSKTSAVMITPRSATAVVPSVRDLSSKAKEKPILKESREK